MSARVIVGAADLNGLRRVAAAAGEVAGDFASVEAVVLLVGGTPVFPACIAVSEVGPALAGAVGRVLVFEAPAMASLGRLVAAAVTQATGDDLAAVLLADSPAAREAAGRLAIELEGSCASMCERVRAVDGGVVAERAIYGGVALGTLVLSHSPAICVFVVGKAEEAAGGPEPEIVASGPLAVETVGYKVVARAPVEKTVELTHARVVVAVGRGFAKAEDLALVDGLRQELGAELGCTRPIAEDFKWLPKERQVGLTGSSVTADLYLAFGVSGQVQHLAGIKDAKVVVAVNNDPKAPIVRNADYVIVDDLYKVLPALTAAVQARG